MIATAVRLGAFIPVMAAAPIFAQPSGGAIMQKPLSAPANRQTATYGTTSDSTAAHPPIDAEGDTDAQTPGSVSAHPPAPFGSVQLQTPRAPAETSLKKPY